jgi:putative DNA primase/helicase
MGDELRLANIRGDQPRKQGSCVIALEGERAGDWIDFDDNQGGGPLSTLEHATGLSGRALIEYAAELAGSMPVNGAKHPIAETLTREQRAENIAREIELILARAVPLGGTLAETYLASRGLQVPATSDLLFHPDLTYWDTRTGYPALIAIVRDVEGERIAIHRTYLAPDGSGKADVPKPRMMLGSVTGGTMRLRDVGEQGVVGLAEGIETALSVMQACPNSPSGRHYHRAIWSRSSCRPRSPASFSSPTMMAREWASRSPRAPPVGSMLRGGGCGSPIHRTPATTSTTCC